METSKAISNRRSIRHYTDQKPSADQLTKILEAGRWAPSGLNNQPWRFKVLEGESKEGLTLYTHYAKVISSAPVAIAVFLSVPDSYNRDKDLMAVGACIENMMLCAHDLGLGTCWLGEILNRKDEVVEFLQLGADLELCAVITLGYPDEKAERKDRISLDGLCL